MKFKVKLDAELAPVRGALEAWRKTRKPRQAIPEILWTQMAALARTYGVSPVAQALGLDYYHLKRRAADVAEESLSGTSKFVELKFPSAALGFCVAELEDRRGRKLTVRWGAAPGLELLGVVQAFWSQGQ